MTTMLLCDELRALLIDPETGVERRSVVSDVSLYGGAICVELFDAGSIRVTEDRMRWWGNREVSIEVTGSRPSNAVLAATYDEIAARTKRATLGPVMSSAAFLMPPDWIARGWTFPDAGRKDPIAPSGLVAVRAVHTHWAAVMTGTVQPVERDVRIVNLLMAGDFRAYDTVFFPRGTNRAATQERINDIRGGSIVDEMEAEMKNRDPLPAQTPIQHVIDVIRARAPG